MNKEHLIIERDWYNKSQVPRRNTSQMPGPNTTQGQRPQRVCGDHVAYPEQQKRGLEGQGDLSQQDLISIGAAELPEQLEE